MGFISSQNSKLQIQIYMVLLLLTLPTNLIQMFHTEPCAQAFSSFWFAHFTIGPVHHHHLPALNRTGGSSPSSKSSYWVHRHRISLPLLRRWNARVCFRGNGLSLNHESHGCRAQSFAGQIELSQLGEEVGGCLEHRSGAFGGSLTQRLVSLVSNQRLGCCWCRHRTFRYHCLTNARTLGSSLYFGFGCYSITLYRLFG